MLGALYLEFGVADRAFDFFQRSAAQIETSSNNTYLNRQIISGELNPKREAKKLEDAIRSANKAKAESRIANALQESSEIDSEASAVEYYDWTPKRSPTAKISDESCGGGPLLYRRGSGSSSNEYAAKHPT